jgi:hypothetical protein
MGPGIVGVGVLLMEKALVCGVAIRRVQNLVLLREAEKLVERTAQM